VGSTESYTEVARRLGSPESAREVAEACAANALAVAIPCHRVVRKDGGLSGYRWGVRRKRALLQLEGSADREYLCAYSGFKAPGARRNGGSL
jgi:AraC family transcriptional regulator of adaptative response/methylated-DNA-[protein]-cysteine methyltransferase